MSIASMINVESVAFLPAFSPFLWLFTLLNCCMGWMAFFNSRGRHVAIWLSVKSP